MLAVQTACAISFQLIALALGVDFSPLGPDGGLNRFGAGDGRTWAYGDMSIFRIPEAPTWTLFVIGLILFPELRRFGIIAGVIWIMFAIAIVSGGAHYPGFDFKDGALLYLLNVFARFGNGLGAIVSYIMAGTPSPQVAALATFEYGGRFLEVAGLLNYLAAIDAVDITVGRKK